MKTSSEHRARARFSRFIPTPPSVMRALRSLRNAAAQAVYNLLIEKCFGFGQGSVELSYTQIAKVIGRSWRTVARVAGKLRTLGLVVVDSLPCGAYRWRIPVLAEEVKEDPHGVLLVLESSQPLADPILPIPSGYDSSVISPHDSFVISPMTELSWGVACEEQGSGPDFIEVYAPFVSLENAPPKRHDQETYLKRHHHEGVVMVNEVAEAVSGDDESLGHKNLLRKLLELGMKQRVARKLLRENDHLVVAGALERVALRGDIANPAGYVLREVEDGGYEEPLSLSDEAETFGQERKPALRRSDAPMMSVGVKETRAQAQALEAEREAREALSRSQVQILLARFSELSGELKEALKACWTAAKEQMVPNTPRKAEILRDPRFEKMAFREVTTKFFTLLDGGLEPGEALKQMAA